MSQRYTAERYEAGELQHHRSANTTETRPMTIPLPEPDESAEAPDDKMITLTINMRRNGGISINASVAECVEPAVAGLLMRGMLSHVERLIEVEKDDIQ